MKKAALTGEAPPPEIEEEPLIEVVEVKKIVPEENVKSFVTEDSSSEYEPPEADDELLKIMK